MCGGRRGRLGRIAAPRPPLGLRGRAYRRTYRASPPGVHRHKPQPDQQPNVLRNAAHRRGGVRRELAQPDVGRLEQAPVVVPDEREQLRFASVLLSYTRRTYNVKASTDPFTAVVPGSLFLVPGSWCTREARIPVAEQAAVTGLCCVIGADFAPLDRGRVRGHAASSRRTSRPTPQRQRYFSTVSLAPPIVRTFSDSRRWG